MGVNSTSGEVGDGGRFDVDGGHSGSRGSGGRCFTEGRSLYYGKGDISCGIQTRYMNVGEWRQQSS